MISRRLFNRIAAAGFAATLLAGPALAQDQVTLSFVRPASAEVFAQVYQPMLDSFMEANPHIKVEPVIMGFDETYQRFPLQASAGGLPDVFMAPGHLFSTLMAADALLPIDDAAMDPRLKADVPPAFWNAVSTGGKIYGVPGHIAPLVLWYNADIFREAGLDPANPPKTWSEWVAAAKTIKEKTGVAPIGLNGFARNDLTDLFSALFTAASGEWVWDNEKQQLKLDHPAAEKTLAFMRQLVEEGLTQPNVDQYSEDDIRVLLRDGKAAMIVSSTSVISVVGAENAGSKFLTAQVPAADGVDGASVMSIDSWAVAADSAHPQEALALIYWVANEANQKKAAEIYGNVPASNKTLSNDPTYQQGVWPTFVAATQKGFPAKPNTDNMQLSDADLPTMVQSVETGAATPAEAIASLKSQMGWE
jgi:multiple sugar transport system substrate-binding protein